PAHHRDREVRLPLTVFGQASGKREIGASPLVTRVAADGSLGDSHDLSQLFSRCWHEQTGPASALRDEWVGGRTEPFEQVSPDAAVLVPLAEKQAKLGVPMPNVVVKRLGLDGRLPGGPRLLQPPKPQKELGWWWTGLGAFRVEPSGRSVLAGALELGTNL